MFEKVKSMKTTLFINLLKNGSIILTGLVIGSIIRHITQ